MLLGVDVGGTFTDAVLVTEDGVVHTAKAPTTPEDQAEGVMRAIREVLVQAEADSREVKTFAHGMTVATNALLEGKTARTALIATDGFTDVIELGRQARPHLYRLCETPPPPLAPRERRFGAPERCGPNGPLIGLDPERARELVEEVAESEPEAVAIALLHSYAHPGHERMLAGLLADRLGPAVHVTSSSELVGTFREYERTATAVLDAALSPLLGTYLSRLARTCAAEGIAKPEIMQSSGGLATIELACAHAALTVLSGPAGGVGGGLLLAELAGERDVVCLDMGGTSCDVCLISSGQVAETVGRTVAGRPVALPALDVHTVGAGGGSIAWRDGGGALRVGPESAGAVPGPACYGRGGEHPTVTDADLLLGRLPGDAPLAGGLRLDRAAAERTVAGLAAELGLGVRECAAGIVRVAEAEMARALRVMTVERGIDPRGLALMCFGGAGPLHACALAEDLGIETVLCPETSGVLCALGLAAAAPRRDASRTVMLRGAAFSEAAVTGVRRELLARARSPHDELNLSGLSEPERPGQDDPPGAGPRNSGPRGRPPTQEGAGRERMVYEMRYHGQSHELAVESAETEPDELRRAFAEAHDRRYGYRDEAGEVELVTVRASVWGAAPELRLGADPTSASHGPDAPGEDLRGPIEEPIEGPAVCPLPGATLYVPTGWAGRRDPWGTIRLERLS